MEKFFALIFQILEKYKNRSYSFFSSFYELCFLVNVLEFKARKRENRELPLDFICFENNNFNLLKTWMFESLWLLGTLKFF